MTQLTVRLKNGRLVRQGLQNLAAEVSLVGQGPIYKAMQRARKRLAAYPPSPRRVHWDSEKQRRAYFASNGFGGGIPYTRTGRYGKGWRITKTGVGTKQSGYTLSNTVSSRGRLYAKYISGDAQGEGQSRIHRGRWIKLRPAVEREVHSLPAEVRANLQMILRRHK